MVGASARLRRVLFVITTLSLGKMLWDSVSRVRQTVPEPSWQGPGCPLYRRELHCAVDDSHPTFELSIVIVGRVDTYGVGREGTERTPAERFQVSMDVLEYQIARFGKDVPIEVIFVEWNAVDGKRIVDAIRIPRIASFRIITVPVEQHLYFRKFFPNQTYAPVLENVGRNVGVRRARGRFVLPMAMDTILTSEWWSRFGANPMWLLELELRLGLGEGQHVLHRTVRADSSATIPKDLPTSQIETWMKEHVFRAWTVGYNGGIRMGNLSSAEVREGLHEVYQREGKGVLEFTSASGDFQMMQRKGWIYLRGYFECPTYGHFDTVLQLQAHHKFAGVVHRDPIFVLHQWHGGGGFLQRLSQVSIKETDHDVFGKGYHYPNPNGCDWGFRSIAFEEREWCDGKEKLF